MPTLPFWLMIPFEEPSDGDFQLAEVRRCLTIHKNQLELNLASL